MVKIILYRVIYSCPVILAKTVYFGQARGGVGRDSGRGSNYSIEDDEVVVVSPTCCGIIMNSSIIEVLMETYRVST